MTLILAFSTTIVGMISCHFFDQLPVEILHNLFDYFVAHEILFTFTDVSDYVNGSLRAYSAYKFIFKSIRKADFDLVCRCIQPKQVVSLTLCDDADTPGQSQLFFSRFHIEQFVQLRSLRLIELEPKTCRYIAPYLWKMNLLRSLCFDYITRQCAYVDEYYLMTSLQSNNHTQVASRLNRLHLQNEKILIARSYPDLYYLKLNTSSADQLETIFHHASQLRSLHIHLITSKPRIPLVFPPNYLIRLDLEIERKYDRSQRLNYKQHQQCSIVFLS